MCITFCKVYIVLYYERLKNFPILLEFRLNNSLYQFAQEFSIQFFWLALSHHTPFQWFIQIQIETELKRSAIISVKAQQAIRHGIHLHYVFNSFVIPKLFQEPEEEECCIQ